MTFPVLPKVGHAAETEELKGATYADGLVLLSLVYLAAFPILLLAECRSNRYDWCHEPSCVTIGAIFIAAGLIPKVGAIISSVPIEVLGGGVIVMFGMVAAAGINMLSQVNWNRRNMMILRFLSQSVWGFNSFQEPTTSGWNSKSSSIIRPPSSGILGDYTKSHSARRSGRGYKQLNFQKNAIR